MKKNTRERPPARRLNRQELDTSVLAAGCGTQGCPPPPPGDGSIVSNPLPIRILPGIIGRIRFF